METILHTGIEHPSLAWILVSALVSFTVGLLVGALTLGPPVGVTSPETDHPEE